MTAQSIIDGLWMVSHRGANTYLLQDGDGLVLIDTGFPGSADIILGALQGLGRSPADIRNIVLTHAHYDHIGSLATLAGKTGATTWIHDADKPIAEGAIPFRNTKPAPGLLRAVLFRVFAGRPRSVQPSRIDQTIADKEVLPLAGGLRAIHAPGHCAGQVALLWEARGVLFTGDVCMNVLGLGDPIAFEDEVLGRDSQRRLARLDFSVACFGHGRPRFDGSTAFRARWP